MLKPIKTLLKHNVLFIAIIITIAIAFLSLIKLPEYKTTIHNADKVEHVLAYFTLTISWLFTFYSKPSKKYFITIACIIYGIIIELFQNSLTNYRTGDYLDVLANSFGVVLALLIFNQKIKKNTVN